MSTTRIIYLPGGKILKPNLARVIGDTNAKNRITASLE
jgi:hypothetical protein